MTVRDTVRTRRRIALAAGAAALALLLSGCFTGDAAVTSFTREFSNDPVVSRLDLSSADNMPFSGGVGGTVHLVDDVDQSQVVDLSARVAEFGDDYRVRIDLAFDDWRVPVLRESRANTDLLDVVGQLRADARVQTATFSSSDYDADIDHVMLIATAETDIRSLFSDAPTLLADTGMSPTLSVRRLAGPAEAVEFTGRPGPWTDAAFAAYDALRSAVALTAFQAGETAIGVRVRDEADVERARAITDDALDGSGIEVFFSSDLVTLAPGAHGHEVRALLAALADETRDDLDGVWTDDSTATLTIASLAEVENVAAEVTRAPATLDSVTLTVGAADAPVLRLASEPAALAADAAIALALLERDGVETLSVQPEHSMRLGFAVPPTDDDLAIAAGSLKSLSRSGERVCVDSPEGTFCVDADSTISTADGAADANAFIEAWNAAPARRAS
ncbi:hypothetical protein [Agromyces atrinae]|uniref:Uncharacterized protein n=1 Tax=Agromyces atrinae TaxID=592376 RepID=A0A4V1R2C5_9MICO|nr:hypothetical protein [Agromyces atrinae]NYD66360.1 hypothetical protein [Agromyces atrinae]RXZ86676.1 hypothetical protein ESP50_09850 [Agromyces atrinae]